MFESPDPTKLRNATLVIGVTLLAISIAQIQIDLSKPVSFLGLPLIIKERNLVAYALMAVSGYFLFRYWYYAMRRKSTWFVRASLFETFSKSDDGNSYVFVAASEAIVESYFEKILHSGIRFDSLESSLIDASADRPEYWEILWKNPSKYSFPTFLRDLDFVAPAILNIAALGFAIRNVVF